MRATGRVGIAGAEDVRKGDREMGFWVPCGDFHLKILEAILEFSVKQLKY